MAEGGLGSFVFEMDGGVSTLVLGQTSFWSKGGLGRFVFEIVEGGLIFDTWANSFLVEGGSEEAGL